LSICTSRRSAFRSASWSHAHRRSLILGNPRHIASARRSPSPSHVGCTLSIFPITFKRAYACEDNGVARTVFPQYSLSSSSSLSPRVCLESSLVHLCPSVVAHRAAPATALSDPKLAHLPFSLQLLNSSKTNFLYFFIPRLRRLMFCSGHLIEGKLREMLSFFFSASTCFS